MKKMCFVTAARSEYGPLKWIMKDIRDCGCFDFQLIVTGGHLSKEQGYTLDYILEDGFEINEIFDVMLKNFSTVEIAETMGRIAQGFARIFKRLKPDYIVVLGDRYELLPICNSAFVMNIPIIHFSGGDVTEGAIDDGIRNALTMLASYHFTGSDDAYNNVVRMRGTSKNVWKIGEPGLDAFYRENKMDRKELAENLGLREEAKWALMTYHPETKETLEYNLRVVQDCIHELIKEKNLQTIITYANTDFGGMQINEYIEEKARQYSEQIKVIPSLGQARYLSYMQQVGLILGNSSSGILEAPFLGIPVINIGNRQKGRHLCENIIQCNPDRESISKAIKKCNYKKSDKNKSDLNYWGDGHTSDLFLKIAKKYLM